VTRTRYLAWLTQQRHLAERLAGLAAILACLALTALLPLLGLWLAGKPLAPYLEFPPRPHPSEPEPFSWPAFVLIAVAVTACLAPFISKILATPKMPAAGSGHSGPFPGFGWLGLALTGLAWFLAWHRFEWFKPLQGSTFTPLWLGYILLVNALALRRSGRSPLTHRTGYLLALFPLSAAFWWGFEFLNRFVANWRYVGLEEWTAFQYFIQNSLPFSTVIPAVYSTAEWLGTHPNLSRGLDRFRPAAPLPAVRHWSRAGLGVGALLLLGLAIWPRILYPAVWLAPILLVSGLQDLRGRETPLIKALATGDFRRLWTFALAGLVCGFFWELWNHESLTHWEYDISHVGRFKLFEMPILGYSGYLPFGLICAAFADCLDPARHRT
jgi:hypothetical protein